MKKHTSRKNTKLEYTRPNQNERMDRKEKVAELSIDKAFEKWARKQGM